MNLRDTHSAYHKPLILSTNEPASQVESDLDMEFLVSRWGEQLWRRVFGYEEKCYYSMCNFRHRQTYYVHQEKHVHIRYIQLTATKEQKIVQKNFARKSYLLWQITDPSPGKKYFVNAYHVLLSVYIQNTSPHFTSSQNLPSVNETARCKYAYATNVDFCSYIDHVTFYLFNVF